MTRPLAVVTGAASGIGLALSTELSKRDVDVIAIDKDPCPFASMPGITTAQFDIRDTSAMQALAETYAGRPLDYLFANAGIAAPGSVFGASDDDWQRAWAVNTMGPLNTLRCWWPHLKAAGGTAVVTASAAALLTYPGAPLYRASKAALLSMLESLYYETQGSGVSLHVLCPGMVRSNIIVNAKKESAAVQSDRLTSMLEQAMRAAEPAEDFARRVLDGLDAAPFYWLTHDKTVGAMEKRHHALVIEGRPPVTFEDMP
ncbi:MAG TPA: SDR family oxidoreductase [Noviherbaspirillum sp.]|nr:SDR family oxidoreductase [Noviherbaspirillum sp.]